MSKHEHVFSVHIKASQQVVWNEITNVDSIQKFYFNSRLKGQLAPGGAVRYESPDGRHVFIMGEVLENKPPSRLVHTFRFADLPDEPTRVTFDLEPAADGVKLTVTHDRFPGETKTSRRVSSGWPSILNNLKSMLERGRLPFGARVQYALMRLAMPFMPKQAQAASAAQ